MMFLKYQPIDSPTRKGTQSGFPKQDEQTTKGVTMNKIGFDLNINQEKSMEEYGMAEVPDDIQSQLNYAQ